MNKQEFYATFIQMQKQTGQGLSGVVKIQSSEMADYLNQLIEEGLAKACDTGGSLGHPESNIFYMPTKGYNVWEDDGIDGNYHRHKGRYLHFVRLYLGIVNKEKSESPINWCFTDYLQNPKIMQEYSEWLIRNNNALQEMISLDEIYPEENITLSDNDISWLKERGWYKDDEKISVCLETSNRRFDDGDDDKSISLNKQLIDLYKRSEKHEPGKYIQSIVDAEAEIESIVKGKTIRKRINKWLASQDQKKKIKGIVSKLGG
jgi:hypothetical protein